MAVVKANYIRRGVVGNKRIKDHIRYIEHRPGKDKAKLSRTLFDSDGARSRQEAYMMIDEAEKGTYFYRFVINPDPALEDNARDLTLREITERTMQQLADKLQKDASWIAAIHDDHTPLRHVHGVALLPRLLNIQDLTFLTQKATELCIGQRHERDRAREQQEHKRQREEEEWERER